MALNTPAEVGAVRRTDVRGLVIYPLVFVCLAYIALRSVALPVDAEFLKRLSITVMSVILEALPFLIFGTLLSSIIHLYVNEELIARVIPKNRLLGILAASMMGLVFPVCECAIVPIVRRLIKKGVPIHVAVTFMLAVPLINPLVLFSTWLAFIQFPMFVVYRAIFGLLGSIVIGLIVAMIAARGGIQDIWRKAEASAEAHAASHVEHLDLHEHRSGLFGHLRMIIDHAGTDLYEIGRYFFMGVLISAVAQAAVPAESLFGVGHIPVVSVLVMIAAAYVLSVCSEADAFIARTFMGPFSNASIVAFLVFGPMMDLKNTLMLSSAFKKGFVFLMVGLVAAASLCVGVGLGIFRF